MSGFQFPAWTRISLIFLGSTLVGLGGFVVIKARSVALELTDPPFYHVPSLARVEGTYAELAAGNAADPGGTWECHETEGQQLWVLRRKAVASRVVLLLHGFGDDRWGTSPALRWFPQEDAAIFTYLRRDDALRSHRPAPPVTFGVKESDEVVTAVHMLEQLGTPRNKILLMGRSLGASIGILALAKLEKEGRGPLGGIIWEGAPASSQDFATRLVRGPRDRFWHPFLAPFIGDLGSRWAASIGRYSRIETDLLEQTRNHRFQTPSLCFLATQDRLAPPWVQSEIANRFGRSKVVAVSTWHLHCAEILGLTYVQAIQEATTDWQK